MVTSGSLRQSSRPASVAGLAASASRIVSVEDIGDAVGVNGDEAHGFLARHRAEALAHARLRQAVAAGAQGLHRDEIAVPRLAFRARRHLQFAAIGLFLVDGRTRPPPFASARKMPSVCVRARDRSLMTRPVYAG